MKYKFFKSLQSYLINALPVLMQEIIIKLEDFFFDVIKENALLQ